MFDIAIVEDEDLERLALRKILTEEVAGARIVGEARNGNEAMQLLDGPPIDLMLVDINIPKPTGLEIIQAVRDRRLATKVIITTAYDYFDIMRSAIHLRADDYLLKPIRRETLVSVVRDCLRSLGASRVAEEMAAQVGAFLEKDAYRDCQALVRRHVEWIYGQSEQSPRDHVLDFTTALLNLAVRRGLRLPEKLTRRLSELETMRLDDRSRHAVQSIIRDVVDLLFDVTEERLGQSSERMENVLNYIERNLGTGVTLDDVAQFANVSPSYLSRLFKKTMETTFISYVTKRRMDLAKEMLLDSDEPVTSIALDLSYQDVNYFAKSFRKEFGLSPTEYRKRYRSKETLPPAR